MSDVNKIINSIDDFRDERNWRQYHNPKDLSASISIEAAELLESFQWVNSEEALKKNSTNIEDEIADVLIYSLMLCSDLDLDVERIINDKLNKNALKYPVEK
ncbi:nucleotide pyrophosphohydrolase [Halalkalibacillus halophilus]|uniref:nucleotide pyrophosphohydrolase n=1 Tax=Halalkalibacillus halophilus TaxID=392827 RepID=UPI00041D0533|nr:nucleotide pyrophosphohydrolase [Halalkalibacillus halophilus]